jgi:hypothetical protein
MGSQAHGWHGMLAGVSQSWAAHWLDNMRLGLRHGARGKARNRVSPCSLPQDWRSAAREPLGTLSGDVLLQCLGCGRQ